MKNFDRLGECIILPDRNGFVGDSQTLLGLKPCNERRCAYNNILGTARLSSPFTLCLKLQSERR